jgi:hypothetical protein
MTQTLGEKLAEKVADLVHEVVQIAYQAGYDQATHDLSNDKDLGGGRMLHLKLVSELEVDDNE